MLVYASVQADSNVEIDCLRMEMTNGTNYCVMIESNPVFTIEGDLLKIDSMSFKLNEVSKYTFGNSADAHLSEVFIDFPQIVIHGNAIIINGIWDNNEISLTNFAGQNIPIKLSYNDDKTVISISELQPNVYILKIGSTAFKFII